MVTMVADTTKADMIKDTTKATVAEVAMTKDTIIMTKEVAMVVHADMPAMSLPLDHSKDWMAITMRNLDQNILKPAILKNRSVMDQRRELEAIMIPRLDQNQRTHSHSHHHQKNPIPKGLV